uniref:AT-rich interactive domain-containing protein 3 n=1 Tax=Chelydra serpentina TaxID=8475 RepID=A0A8C3SZF6_CHESE
DLEVHPRPTQPPTQRDTRQTPTAAPVSRRCARPSVGRSAQAAGGLRKGPAARLGARSLLPGALYELDDDPKRKEFLDDLFGFMQKRGTPVNRIPIMAKQVLDLYTLYRLVTEKGGLVEVINKKIWREITKGLNLPTSITSAAFTLRTQYMKYLYPYECEKRALSSPGELQAAIDSNRREGRRHGFGTALFSYSPAGTPAMLASPKLPIATHGCGQMSQVPFPRLVVPEDGVLSAALPSRLAIPVSLAGHHIAAAQAAAASQAAALEQLREKLETGEPPEKKMALMAGEQQRLMQHALQQNLLAMASQFPMNIKINDRQETALNLSTNGISSINMSIEINGVVYTVLQIALVSRSQFGGGGCSGGRGSSARGLGFNYCGIRSARVGGGTHCTARGPGTDRWMLQPRLPRWRTPLPEPGMEPEIPESQRSFAVHKRPSGKPAGKASLMAVGWQRVTHPRHHRHPKGHQPLCTGVNFTVGAPAFNLNYAQRAQTPQ